MTAFAQSDLSKAKWLSRETIHRITTERLSSPYSIIGIKTTLSYYARDENTSPAVKLTVLRLLGSQQNLFDATSAKDFVDAAFVLRSANPAVESELTEPVHLLGARFKGSDEVFTSYVRYLKKMSNKKFEFELFEELFPDTRVEENDLMLIASAAYLLKNEESYSFLAKVLSQLKLTARGLSKLIEIVGPTEFIGFKPVLSLDAKRILTLIVAHGKATDEVRKQANQFLNPTMDFIEDPRADKN